MTIDLNIINGLVFTERELLEGGIAIEGERILKVGKEPSLPKASKKINVKGALILPGIIDIHVHLRDFVQHYKETILTGTKAAVAGGVTTVIDMPNNIPPTDSVERIRNKKVKAEGKAFTNIGFYSLLPEKINEIYSLVNEGIFGFKIYPASPIYPDKNNRKLVNYMSEIARTKLPFIIHPDASDAEQRELVLLEKNFLAIEAFTKAHNQIEEAKAFENFLKLNNQSDSKLHCAHVTAKETVNVIEKHKENAKITCEVCPHHLMLTERDMEKYRSEAKCLPPLRTKNDQKALWKALKNGLINIIATDHAPHSYNEKHCEFETAAAGIPGLETVAPIMLTAALKGKIPLIDLLPKLTENPANFLQLENRAKLKEGLFADVIIVAKEKNRIQQEEFHSLAKWTPFNGFESLVKVKQVIVNGAIVKDEEHIENKNLPGKILKRRVDLQKELI